FESPLPGDYANPAGVDGWSLIGTNPVRVLNDPLGANQGSQYLSLLHGHIERSLPTTSGQNYTLTFASRNVSNCVNYADFSSTAGLNLVGSAATVGGALRLTPAVGSQVGDAWLKDKQQVGGGFDTTFDFQFTQQGGASGGGDGISLSMQNVGPTDNTVG